MTATCRYHFRKATEADIPLLLEWQSRPHVQEWWDTIEPKDADDLDDPRVDCRIVSFAGRPIAYMQDYAVHGWANHHFFDLPDGTRGIDQFIGDPDMIAKGHGPAFITERLAVLFAVGVPVITTDPDPENARAIAAYRKAGFRAFGPPRDTPWGRILPMRVDR